MGRIDESKHSFIVRSYLCEIKQLSIVYVKLTVSGILTHLALRVCARWLGAYTNIFRGCLLGTIAFTLGPAHLKSEPTYLYLEYS